MQGDPAGAKAVFNRVMQIAVVGALALSLGIFGLRYVLPRLFTSDAAVIHMAGQHLPILAILLVRPLPCVALVS